MTALAPPTPLAVSPRRQRFRSPRLPRRQGRPSLVAADEQHFAAIAECFQQPIANLSDRLDADRRAPGGEGQSALDWDPEIHRLTGRLRTALAQR